MSCVLRHPYCDLPLYEDWCLFRGSPCQYPEETLEGYRQAALDGADYLELDVVGGNLYDARFMAMQSACVFQLHVLACR